MWEIFWRRCSTPAAGPAGARSPGTRRSRASVGEEDRRLLNAVAVLDDEALRRLTAWMCRTSCHRAGLEDLEWVAPALTALEPCAPLPLLFDDDVRPLAEA